MGTKKSVELNETSEMRRFFVALLPPVAVQTAANAIKAAMRDEYHSKAAFRSPPHITLHAPFEWPGSELVRLRAALETFAASRFAVPVTLDGFGAFEPHVIYINVVRSEGLMTLQRQLAVTMADELGVVGQRDRYRAFVPHLTVAFRDLKLAMFRQAWPAYQHREIHFDFLAAELTLLLHDGKRWIVQESYPFHSR